MVDISVIIVNYNTCKITSACLDSIFKHTEGIEYEVIVVDNNSTKDNSKEVLSKYSGIIYIQSDQNVGYGRANNLGYTRASGRYILILNSDTYLLNNALKCFVDSFDTLPPNVACIGAQLLAPDGSLNNSYGELPTITGTIKSIINIYRHVLGLSISKKNLISKTTEPFEVPYIIGADLCIRRETIEKCGLFDSDFFMYYEDSEMQYRYKMAGFKSIIVIEPQIVHMECVSTKGVSKRIYTYANRKLFLQGQFLYFRKRYSYPVYLLYRIVYLFSFPLYLRSYYTTGERIKLIGRLFSSTRLSTQ
jgi:hypothetical protein